MEEEKKNRQVMLPIVISIITLLVVTVGATYAYFSVSGTNSYGTKTIQASTPEVGTVTLNSGSNLTMALTREQMMKKSGDVAYYATNSGATTTETSPVIAEAVVSGQGTYTCTYTIEITKSATSDLYTAFQAMSGKSAGQIVLTVGGTAYDFNTQNLFTSNKIIVNGSFTGITSSSTAASRQLTAQLKFVNKETVVQDALQGKDITLTFAATSFECNATA